jgi:UDP-glucose 4-epimerase
MMNILVLGGAGFLGSKIVEALLESGHTVSVFDKYCEKPINTNLTVIQAKFDDIHSLEKALRNIDIVIHLISTTVPSTSNEQPVYDVEGNLVNTLNLLKLMNEAGVKRIIYFSSGGTVYGKPNQLPIRENHPTNPICSYGIVKLAIEKYLQLYQDLYGFNVTILRPSNPYGIGQRNTGVQGVIAAIMHRALSEETIIIWGDGSVERDYIYISDVVSACMAVINQNASGLYNISTGHGVSVNQLINITEKIIAKPIHVKYEPKRNFDIERVILSNELAKNELNWSPKVDLEQGIARYFNSIQDLNRTS